MSDITFSVAVQVIAACWRFIRGMMVVQISPLTFQYEFRNDLLIGHRAAAYCVHRTMSSMSTGAESE